MTEIYFVKVPCFYFVLIIYHIYINIFSFCTGCSSSKKTTCFNCGGDHLLDNCAIPRDQKRIAKNRSAHFKRQSNARYISDAEVSGYK